MSEDQGRRRRAELNRLRIQDQDRWSEDMALRPIRPHPDVITITCDHRRTVKADDPERAKLDAPTYICGYNRNVLGDGSLSWTLTTVADPRLATAHLNMRRSVRHDYILNGVVYDESIIDRGMPPAGRDQVDLTGLQVRTVFVCKPCGHERALQFETLKVVLSLVYDSGVSAVTLAGISSILRELARQRKRSGQT